MGSGGTNAGYQVELNKIADAVATPADSQVAVAPGHPQHFAVDSRPEPGSAAPPGFTPPPGSASSATGLVQPADWADPQTDLNPLWRPRPHPLRAPGPAFSVPERSFVRRCRVGTITSTGNRSLFSSTNTVNLVVEDPFPARKS